MTKTDNPAHDEIRRLLGTNADTVTKNLHALWHRFVEDMVAAGIPRTVVADSLFTVSVPHKIVADGVGKAVELLRLVADYHERQADEGDAEETIRKWH